MSGHVVPCGHCSQCRSGFPSSCYFPHYKGDVIYDKSFSDVSASSLKTEKVKKGNNYERCYETHPPLKIGEIVIYGGSASKPKVEDCDIYISLDGYSTPDIGVYPWEEGPKPIIVTFAITDQSAPKDIEQFKKMVAWLKEQALAGKKIHIGCMGGHGRTGTLLSALAKEIGGIEDAIDYVRKNYCAKAVESSAQVEFLHKHFGITKQKPSKSYYDSGSSYSSPGYKSVLPKGWPNVFKHKHDKKFGHSSDDVAYSIKPAKCEFNVWGDIDNQD